MDRIIQFRAWHIAEKVMCRVDTLTDTGAFLIGVKKGEDTYSRKYYIPAPGHGRFCDNEEFHLLQFTGLIDKEGCWIFEGHIVEHEYESDCGPVLHTDEVVYQGGAFYPVCEKPATEFRVIGHIFEKK